MATKVTEHGHAAKWRHWLGHLVDQPAWGLELGTWKGESAEWMLDNVFTHPASRYVCVDTFEGSAEHHLLGIDCTTLERDARARLARFSGRAVIQKEASASFLRELNGSRFDLLYVDADHSAHGVLRDAVLGFDLLKVGGVIVFDDYDWHEMPDPLDCPRMAVDAFAACYARQMVELDRFHWQRAFARIK